MNSFRIHEPFINIANNDLLFEQYRMAINRGKYDIEVQNDDTIKHNQFVLILCNRHSIDWMEYIYVKDVF